PLCALHSFPTRRSSDLSLARAGDREARRDLAPQDLAVLGPWEIPREVDDLRRLVRGEVLASEREHLVRRDWCIGPRDHVRDDERSEEHTSELQSLTNLL